MVMLQIISSLKVELLVRLIAEQISFIEYLFRYNDFSENDPKFKYSGLWGKGFRGNKRYELVSPTWVYIFFNKRRINLTTWDITKAPE